MKFFNLFSNDDSCEGSDEEIKRQFCEENGHIFTDPEATGYTVSHESPGVGDVSYYGDLGAEYMGIVKIEKEWEKACLVCDKNRPTEVTSDKRILFRPANEDEVVWLDNEEYELLIDENEELLNEGRREMLKMVHEGFNCV